MRQIIFLCVTILSCTSKPVVNNIVETQEGAIDSTADATFATTDSLNQKDSPLRVYLEIFHRGSGDMTSGNIMISPGKDTVRFFKRKYSENFRIYRMRFNQSSYALKNVTLSGYNRKQKLYTTNPRVRYPSTGPEFMDEHMSMREDHLRLEAVFQHLATKTDSVCHVLVVLDREWQ